jgi:hypothetical protein
MPRSFTRRIFALPRLVIAVACTLTLVASGTAYGQVKPDTDMQAEAAVIATYVTAGYTFTTSDYEGTNLDWGVIPAILVSVGRTFGVDIDKYLSSYGLKITTAVQGECIASFAAAYPGLTYQQLVKVQYANPFQVPVLVRIMNHLLMGTAPGHPGMPLLFGVGNADGTGDGIMVAGDVEALAYEYCQQGVPVTFDEYSGLQHTEAAVRSRPTR